MQKVLFVFVFLASLMHSNQFDAQNRLKEYYKKLENDIKIYTQTELKSAFKDKKRVKQQIINTLAKNMAYSAVYIKEEYISSENDVFNNEILKVVTKVYKTKLKRLDKTYKQNRQKLFSLENLLKNLKQKVDKLEFNTKNQKSKTSSINNINQKIDSIIDSFSSTRKENISTLDLNSFIAPIDNFDLKEQTKDGFLLLQPTQNNKVLATLDAKVIYIDRFNNSFQAQFGEGCILSRRNSVLLVLGCKK